MTDAEGAFGAMRWPAPAKINRFLHITGRRADGYHLLQTLFQFLDWGDELEIAPRADGPIVRTAGPDAIPPEQDLALRAAEALRRATDCRQGATIGVHKRIPSGAGLGGGSSDAATVLVALNRLWELELTPAELADIGLGLGADVPVFIHGHACWAEGIGERLTPVDPEEGWAVVALPDGAVATAAAYAHPQLRRDCAPVGYDDFLTGRTDNVFEPVARALAPAVDAAMNALTQAAADEPGAAPARLSGSGAACFVATSGRAEARRIQARLPAPLRSVVARVSNRSALRLASELPLGR